MVAFTNRFRWLCGWQKWREIRGNFEGDKQVGLWEYFDEKGNLDHTEEYKDGEPIE